MTKIWVRSIKCQQPRLHFVTNSKLNWAQLRCDKIGSIKTVNLNLLKLKVIEVIRLEPKY